jgi:hypothetical protein
MEARCEPLKAPALAAAAEQVLAWIEERSADVDVMFGWAYEHVESQWKWRSLPVARLRGTLQASGKRGAFVPGDGDVHVRIPAADAEFTLCHECDIHVVSGNSDFVRSFVDAWSSRGIASWTRATSAGPWVATA